MSGKQYCRALMWEETQTVEANPVRLAKWIGKPTSIRLCFVIPFCKPVPQRIKGVFRGLVDLCVLWRSSLCRDLHAAHHGAIPFRSIFAICGVDVDLDKHSKLLCCGVTTREKWTAKKFTLWLSQGLTADQPGFPCVCLPELQEHKQLMYCTLTYLTITAALRPFYDIVCRTPLCGTFYYVVSCNFWRLFWISVVKKQ